MIGEIILVNSIEQELESQLEVLPPSGVRVYEDKEIQQKHIHEIITEAHIATDELKTIIIAAHSFRIEAQNALLKILEEPPENVKFLLISRNKTAFIPTIRSRLILQDKRSKQAIVPFALDLRTLSLESIYHFTRELAKDERDSRIHGRELISSLLLSAAQAGMSLGQKELESFDSALHELENYRPKHLVCLNLLLMLKRVHSAPSTQNPPAPSAQHQNRQYPQGRSHALH